MLDFGQLVVGDADGGEPGGDRFEQPAHLHQVQQRARVGLKQLHGAAEPLQQHARLQAADIRAVAPLDLQHAGDGQGLDRLARQIAGQPQLSCQLRFRGQLRTGRQGAGPDQLTNLLDGLVRQ